MDVLSGNQRNCLCTEQESVEHRCSKRTSVGRHNLCCVSTRSAFHHAQHCEHAESAHKHERERAAEACHQRGQRVHRHRQHQQSLRSQTSSDRHGQQTSQEADQRNHGQCPVELVVVHEAVIVQGNLNDGDAVQGEVEADGEQDLTGGEDGGELEAEAVSTSSAVISPL